MSACICVYERPFKHECTRFAFHSRVVSKVHAFYTRVTFTLCLVCTVCMYVQKHYSIRTYIVDISLNCMFLFMYVSEVESKETWRNVNTYFMNSFNHLLANV